MTKRQQAALRRAANAGKYHLLLGAGASLEARNAKGHTLPGSARLIRDLVEEFSVLAEDGDQLWRIYDRAVLKYGHSRVYSWFRSVFTGTTPPGWMEYLAKYPWKRVWTLNVDDTFENAYRLNASPSARELISVNWDDEYSDAGGLDVVHLHGVANRNEPCPLVFSLSEYSSSAQSRAAWPAVFRGEYGASPFVIIGARVRDEPDIETVIRNRRLVSDAPSLYVARDISPGTEEDLRSWGLIPVQMSAEDFVLSWAELTGLDLDGEAEDQLSIAIRIGRQFSEVTKKSLEQKSKHDFLGGDVPDWSDARSGLIAELKHVSAMRADCYHLGDTLNPSSVVAYLGRSLTGRSAALRSVGEYLLDSGYRTFFYEGQGRLDLQALLNLGASGRDTALLFDGFIDIADDIDTLISQARTMQIALCVVGVDDSRNEQSILGKISTRNLAFGRLGMVGSNLTKVDAGKLVDKLAEHARLGILEHRSDGVRIGHFRGKNIFSSMALLEEAPGFGLRVNLLVERLSKCPDPLPLQNAVLLVSYAAQVGREITLLDLARMIGIDSDELYCLLEGQSEVSEISDLISTDGVWVRPRQRYLALEPIIESLSPSLASEMLMTSIRRVDSLLTLTTWRDRTSLSRVVGAFMQIRNLQRAFPKINHDQWYQGLFPVFGSWSARYWEQRAILGRSTSDDLDAISRAESFASRAVSLWKDAYSLTTLGTVLMTKAQHGAVDTESYYARARDAFSSAIELDNGSNLVASGAYLSFTLGLLESLAQKLREGDVQGSSRDLFRRVSADWEEYFTARAVAGQASDAIKSEHENMSKRYRRIVRGV